MGVAPYPDSRPRLHAVAPSGQKPQSPSKKKPSKFSKDSKDMNTGLGTTPRVLEVLASCTSLFSLPQKLTASARIP
jgi:hypothetical protein